MSDYWYPRIMKLTEEVEQLKKIIIRTEPLLKDCRDCKLKIPHGTSKRSWL